MTSKILCVPDLHEPWSHPRAYDFIRYLLDKYQIDPANDTIVVLGDEIDSHSISRWDTDPDMPSAGDEMDRAITAMQKWYALFPSAFVCESNHTARIYKRAFQAGLPRRVLRDYNDWLGAPEGWQWRDRLVLGDILFIHGDGFSGKYGALRAAEAHRTNVVLGHIHTFPGVQWSWGLHKTVWAMNAGCLIDATQPVFSYGKHLASRPGLGAGVIIDGVPHWEPMRI